jgi:XTP/dITP diphosphohydrolase
MPPRPHPNRLVVASANAGKLEELRALLAGLPLEVHGWTELLPELPSVVEDGETFAENAVKKASAIAQATMMLSLADDSGLEVEVLGGRPGVKSARFAHARATDAENNAALLTALGALDDASSTPALASGPSSASASPASDPFSVPAHSTQRSTALALGPGGLRARFRCVLALIDPFANGGEARTVEGVCEGHITRTPRGTGGFGYDPLFVVSGTGKTMAELDPATKNRVSHRALAFAALRPLLERVLEERREQIARLVRSTPARPATR